MPFALWTNPVLHSSSKAGAVVAARKLMMGHKISLLSGISSRIYSTQESKNNRSDKKNNIISYFKLFPTVFPNNGPPKDAFKVNQRKLRKEYLKLQADSHPDILIGSNQLNNEQKEQLQQEAHAKQEAEPSNLTADEVIAENSKVLNRAYATLKSPLTRSQHYLALQGIDVTNDDSAGNEAETSNANNLFKKIASSDQELLLMILDIHEQLESCGDYEELKQLKKENDERIEQSENLLDELYKSNNLERATVETIKLNYWFNIKNAIKEWEPGKRVNLTH